MQATEGRQMMRFSRLLAGLATAWLLPQPAVADGYSDFNQCKFIGEASHADQNIAACDRVLADPRVTGPDRAAAFSNRCGWWWAGKDLDRALPDCNAAIQLDRFQAAAYVNRGNIYLNKGDVDRAFGDFNEAIRVDPGSAWAYSARGELYQSKGDAEHALADFSLSIRLDPNYALAYFYRSQSYKGQGDFERALVDLDRSIRLDPNDARAYFARGGIFYIMGNQAGALTDFTKSIKLAPDNAAAYFNRGVSYFVVGGRIADAQADFRRTTELNPGDAYAALWLDLAQRQNGVPSQLSEAVKRLDMNAWPAAIIRRFLGQLSAAQAIAAARDPDPATRLGESCEANFYSGEFALQTGNKPEAQRLLRQAASDCPRNFIESTAAIAELIAQR